MAQPKIHFKTPNNGRSVRCAEVENLTWYKVGDVANCLRLSIEDWDPAYSRETRSVLTNGRPELYMNAAGLIGFVPPGNRYWKERQIVSELLLIGPQPAQVVPMIPEPEKAG